MTPIRTVALVGRPNVGKSRLFNRLARRRIAIVHDQAGVTRDVNAVDVQGETGTYSLLDTGGIGLQVDMSQKQLVAAAEEQVFVAAQAATLICFVVDAREGLTPMDEMIADRIRSFGKSALLVVNKVDHEGYEDHTADFARLGLGAGVAVSAEHGFGEDELRKAIEAALPPAPEVSGEGEEPERRIRISFIGRPNVGKSSLCNALLKSERLVVSEVPGTTRDAIELDLDYTTPRGKLLHFRLIDTAGIRRKQRIDTPVEYFSSLRTQRAMEDSDVVFVVVDAMEGVTKQEQSLLGQILQTRPAVAVIVNKWDYARETFKEGDLRGYEDEADFRDKFAESVNRELFFLPDSPVLFVSAKTGYYTEKILQEARRLDERMDTRLPTPQVTRLIQRMIEKRSPRRIEGKRFKVYYAVQTSNRPFKIRVFCNRAHKLDDGYLRYLEGGFIEEFALHGCPIRFELVGKEQRYSGSE